MGVDGQVVDGGAVHDQLQLVVSKCFGVGGQVDRLGALAVEELPGDLASAAQHSVLRRGAWFWAAGAGPRQLIIGRQVSGEVHIDFEQQDLGGVLASSDLESPGHVDEPDACSAGGGLHHPGVKGGITVGASENEAGLVAGDLHKLEVKALTSGQIGVAGGDDFLEGLGC